MNDPNDIRFHFTKRDFIAGVIDYIQAIEALEQLCNLSSKDAESIVEAWEYELDTKRQ